MLHHSPASESQLTADKLNKKPNCSDSPAAERCACPAGSQQSTARPDAQPRIASLVGQYQFHEVYSKTTKRHVFVQYSAESDLTVSGQAGLIRPLLPRVMSHPLQLACYETSLQCCNITATLFSQLDSSGSSELLFDRTTQNNILLAPTDLYNLLLQDGGLNTSGEAEEQIPKFISDCNDKTNYVRGKFLGKVTTYYRLKV